MQINIHHFVVTSVLAHVAIFAAWSSASSQRIMIPASEASAPTLHVALQTSETTSSRHSVRQRPARHKIREVLKHKSTPQQRVPGSRQTRSTVHKKHSMTPAVANAQSLHQAQLHREQIRNRVLTRIRTDLRQYFVYPLLAQRRGWQGRVVLAFSVEANGMIRNIHVASGSGHPILDTSAVTALSRVHQLYPDNDSFPGASIHLKLPVIFELQGG